MFFFPQEAEGTSVNKTIPKAELLASKPAP